jgi:hypothetical protein
MEKFAYFMIRVQAPAQDGATTFGGLVERLATGEKRSFQSGDDLVRLVSDWSDSPSRGAEAGGPGNHLEEDT